MVGWCQQDTAPWRGKVPIIAGQDLHRLRSNVKLGPQEGDLHPGHVIHRGPPGLYREEFVYCAFADGIE